MEGDKELPLLSREDLKKRLAELDSHLNEIAEYKQEYNEFSEQIEDADVPKK